MLYYILLFQFYLIINYLSAKSSKDKYMSYYFFIGIFFGIVMYMILLKLTKTKKTTETESIVTLIRGCARWAIASKQDTSPLISLLHANYAAGYLWALQDCFTDDQIHNATGINIIKFQKSITRVQDKATRGLVSVCPGYASDLDSYLSKISGES
jgi:hypothetical protein